MRMDRPPAEIPVTKIFDSAKVSTLSVGTVVGPTTRRCFAPERCAVSAREIPIAGNLRQMSFQLLGV